MNASYNDVCNQIFPPFPVEELGKKEII